MEILNVNMREQIKQLKLQRSKEEEKWDVLGKVCNGKFVWKITNFSEQYQKMLQNNQFVIYSHPFYTSPFGYKVKIYKAPFTKLFYKAIFIQWDIPVINHYSF